MKNRLKCGRRADNKRRKGIVGGLLALVGIVALVVVRKKRNAATDVEN